MTAESNGSSLECQAWHFAPEACCRLLFSTGVEAKVAQNETVVRQGVTAEKAAAKQRQTQHE